MYHDHSSFVTPKDDIIVWRYMDFTKFISMLEGSNLFFSRPDSFDDPFEGSWPKLNVENRFNGSNIPKEIQNEISLSFKHLINNVYINCWHMNHAESDAMWKIYTKNKEGVAIQSSIRNIKRSLVGDSRHVCIGKVNYIDYTNGYIPMDNNNGLTIFDTFLYKRESFSHEREVRLMTLKQISDTKDSLGVSVEINLNELIEKIYITPFASSWFIDLIKNVAEKYELNVEIIQSGISKIPMY